MIFSTSLFIPSLFLLSSVNAFNYTIGVGKDEVTGLPGIGFDPSRTVVTANGDFLVFSFLQGNHNVVQVNFNSPCASNGGFSTGLVSVPNGTVAGGPSFSLVVTNISVPLWFADIADVNCQQGAVFCMNSNETTTESCGAFKAAALALGASEGVTTSVRTNTPYSTTTTTTPPASSTAANVTSSSTSSAVPTQTSKPAGGEKVRVGGLVGLVLGAVGVVALAV